MGLSAKPWKARHLQCAQNFDKDIGNLLFLLNYSMILKKYSFIPYHHNQLGWNRVIVCPGRLSCNAKAPLQAALARTAGHEIGNPLFSLMPESSVSFQSSNTGGVEHFTSASYGSILQSSSF